jgi:MFS family permease
MKLPLSAFFGGEIKEDGNWRALRHHNFLILFRANAVSNIGSWIQRVAQAWLVLELTNSGTYLGIIAALQFAPFLMVSMQGGAMADRLDKQKVLLVTNSLFLLSSIVLGALIVFGKVEIWHVMVMALVLGLTDGIDKPVRQSYVSELVGLKDMPNAISLNSVNFNFGRLAGPAIAGFLIAILGTGPAFIINGFSYIFVVSAFYRIKKDQLFAIPRNTGPVKIREGIRYVRARPDIFVTMAACSILATFGFNFELFNALMATKEFNGGVASFGMLGTAVAVGVIISSFTIATARKIQIHTFCTIRINNILLLPSFNRFHANVDYIRNFFAAIGCNGTYNCDCCKFNNAIELRP